MSGYYYCCWLVLWKLKVWPTDINGGCFATTTTATTSTVHAVAAAAVATAVTTTQPTTRTTTTTVAATLHCSLYIYIIYTHTHTFTKYTVAVLFRPSLVLSVCCPGARLLSGSATIVFLCSIGCKTQKRHRLLPRAST